MAFDRNTPEYKRWRRNVIWRDGCKCTRCGADTQLEAHHIKPVSEYPELALDTDNGITLCKKCHYELDGRHYNEYNEYKHQIKLVGPVKELRAVSYKIKYHLETLKNVIFIGPLLYWLNKKFCGTFGLFVILGLLYLYNFVKELFQ